MKPDQKYPLGIADRPPLRVRRMPNLRSPVLLGVATMLMACSTQPEPGDDGGAMMTPGNESDASPVMVPTDETDASLNQDPYPQCTLANAQKALEGTWSRTDTTDVWSEEQRAQCKARCGDDPNPDRCAQDKCEGGLEYLACVFGWRYHCASQPESGCAEDYRIFGCCVLSNCVADDAECVAFSCGGHADRMDECAADQCAISAREMCVR